MNGRKIQQLSIKYLLPYLPGYKATNRLIFQQDPMYLLKGLWFESSSYDANRFTISAFIQPLFVPSDDLYFNYGNRLGHISGGGDIWWEYSKYKEESIFKEIIDYIRTEALPFFDEISSPEEFYEKYKSTADEAIGYALVLVGEYKQAQSTIEKYLDYLTKEIAWEPVRNWIQVEYERVQMVSKKLKDDPKKAVAQLNDWRDETLGNLGFGYLTSSKKFER